MKCGYCELEILPGKGCLKNPKGEGMHLITEPELAPAELEIREEVCDATATPLSSPCVLHRKHRR